MRTLPARISPCAFARDSASPRRTSSASSRRRVPADGRGESDNLLEAGPDAVEDRGDQGLPFVADPQRLGNDVRGRQAARFTQLGGVAVLDEPVADADPAEV